MERMAAPSRSDSTGHIAALARGIRTGDRATLARAITLIESKRTDHRKKALALLQELLPSTGKGIRVGITGAPGVGKSTTIDAMGTYLTGKGHKVAVLAIDPSSTRTGGSILGDKTRMARLATDPNAFIRPSPSSGTLGGVAAKTRETMLLCEAAGFDVVLVETVGIGQSEVAVASMVDFFAALLQPGAGDELQGIKRGVLELADALVVTKADGDLKALAERTRAEFTRALELFRPASGSWQPVVVATSARTGEGIPGFWELVEAHRRAVEASGELQERRREQARAWVWSLVEEGLLGAFRHHPGVSELLPVVEKEVEARQTAPAAAARRLLEAFGRAPRS
jgi:LAO/AO transport system kinase